MWEIRKIGGENHVRQIGFGYTDKRQCDGAFE